VCPMASRMLLQRTRQLLPKTFNTEGTVITQKFLDFFSVISVTSAVSVLNLLSSGIKLKAYCCECQLRRAALFVAE